MKEHDIKETALLLRDEMAKATKLTSDVSLHTVFLSAETIIKKLRYFIELFYRKIKPPKMDGFGRDDTSPFIFRKIEDLIRKGVMDNESYFLGYEHCRKDISKRKKKAMIKFNEKII